MLPSSQWMLLAGGRQGRPYTDSHLSWGMPVHLVLIRLVYFIYLVNLDCEQNFKLKLWRKLKTNESFRPQLLRRQVSCLAHNVLRFERGVKEAIYIRPKGPTLNRDGGRYNLLGVWYNLFLKTQNRERGWTRASQYWITLPYHVTRWTRQLPAHSEQDFSWGWKLFVFNFIRILSLKLCSIRA